MTEPITLSRKWQTRVGGNMRLCDVVLYSKELPEYHFPGYPYMTDRWHRRMTYHHVAVTPPYTIRNKVLLKRAVIAVLYQEPGFTSAGVTVSPAGSWVVNTNTLRRGTIIFDKGFKVIDVIARQAQDCFLYSNGLKVPVFLRSDEPATEYATPKGYELRHRLHDLR